MSSIHDHPAVESFRAQRRIDRHQLRRFYYALYQGGHAIDRCLAELPVAHHQALRNHFRLRELQLVDRSDSQHDGATKLLFRTGAGRTLESVILRSSTGRTSLCVSAQVGCAAGCQFCATGYMGPRGNLSSSEILDQVLQANQLLADEGRRVRNVLFMGMGEPLHNEQAVYQALDLLLAERGFGFSPRRVIVSTVGVPAAMERLARKYPKVVLALSLHSARQQRREQLIPLAGRHSLTALRTAIRNASRLQQQPLLIEYLMLEGITDADEDGAALAEFLAGVPVHLNLIPFNPIPQAPHLRATPRVRRDEFARQLRERGFDVTIRYSLGSDINAACGQLATADAASRS